MRSDCQAGIYETIRHSRDAFIYPHRGSRHSPRLPLITKTRGFVEPVARLACEFSKVVNALLNSRLGTHFVSSLLKCLAPICRHGFAMHLEGDRRTCACRYIAGAERSTCVQTALHGAYETVRHGRDAFIAPHRGSRHWSGSRSSAKHGGFCATGAACSRTATGTRSRSGAGAAGARSRLALRAIGRFIASVYWCYSKKCLTLGFFVWYIWDY